MESKLMVGRAAVFFTVSKYLTEATTCYNLRQKCSTRSSSAVPYITGALQGAMWMQYGKLMGDNIILTTGLVCMIIHSCCSICCCFFADDKPTVGKMLGAVLFFCLSAAAYLKFFVKNLSLACYAAGVFACIANLINYSAPIILLKDVIMSKSAETLIFRSVFTSLVVNAIWFFYGLLIKNRFIKMPSLVGICLSILQLMMILFLLFKRPELQRNEFEKLGGTDYERDRKYSTFKTSD